MSGVALITGSSRGIGMAIARRLAQDGYHIALNARRLSPDVQAQLDAFHADGIKAAFYACDVSDAGAVADMRVAIENELGAVDVVVNNAGIAQQKLFTDITPSEWRDMMGVHLDGTFYCCREFLPSMIKRHSGVIINVSSMWGQVGGSCEVHYSAAKAGVIGLTKALAKEVGPSGIRVNCVAPGVVLTDMLQDFSEDDLQDLANDTPLMRLGTPEDIAETVAFLVSAKASFITGQVIAPNGGFVI